MTPETLPAPLSGSAHSNASNSGGIMSRLGGTVSARLTALGTALTLLLIVVAVIAITGFGSVKSAYNADQIPGTNRDTAAAAYEGWQAADDQTNMFAALAALHDAKQATLMATTWKQVLAGRAQADKNIGILEKNHLTPKGLALTQKLAKDLATYNIFTNDMYKLISGISSTATLAQATAQSNTAVQYITVDNATISNAVQGDFDTLRNQLANEENVIGAKIPSTTNSRETLSIIIGIVALLLAAIITFLVIRSITKPLAKVAAAADQVAEGRVDVELDVYGRDEISKVADSFRAVIDHLKNMAGVSQTFSTGDYTPEVHARSDDDVLAHSLQGLKVQLIAALGRHSTSRQLESGMGGLLDTLQTLDQGLQSMNDGDLTVAVNAELAPVTGMEEGEEIGFIAERYNQMISSAQASLDGYNSMRETLREKLGDHSSLEALTDRLEALSGQDLNQLQRALKSMNDGDLTIGVTSATSQIAARAGENIGHLAEVFNAMLDNTQGSIGSYNDMRAKIAGMLTEISQSSESLSAASTQMASTSEEAGRAIAEIANAVGSVAQGAEQQVRSVDDAKRITDELAEASRLSAETADETAAAAEEARGLARQGVGAAEEASAAMKAVRDSSAQTSEAIQSLGEKSDQIGGIVATITGIAAQTNLLALNAAIEAARAGEHGRGFAVVAEEVRHLAEESQAAAATIGALIEEIQQETAKAVEVVELGAGQTKEGVETVAQTREVFVRIGHSVEDMSARVEQIATSIRGIAESSDQMRDSMEAVASVAEQSSASTQEVSASTQQSSASTEQIAASAQQLAGTAEELEKMVAQFVLS
jgi:methyl-accepting chemotaxis protein